MKLGVCRLPPPNTHTHTHTHTLSLSLAWQTHATPTLHTGSGGLKLNAQSRAALMARLSESAGLSGPKPSTNSATLNRLRGDAAQAKELPTQGLLGPASPIPTSCILLKNLFDPAEYVPTRTDILSYLRVACAYRSGSQWLIVATMPLSCPVIALIARNAHTHGVRLHARNAVRVLCVYCV